ncbi:MAG: hypothetical protein HC929_23450 [Leptolyngbyaceae cyanobacterium SM2_5_2]|nr:hypothetical protein [Leptolyngbyaceae cyanobacterium SM2_5_2]
MKRLIVALLMGLALVGFPTQAWAHQVETFYSLGAQLEFQSTLAARTFAGATVSIYAPNNPEEPWQTLVTDGEGRFAFVPDESMPGNWEIAIESDDLSHADYWTVPVGDTGIIYDGIVLDSTQDQHYVAAASTFGPLAMAVAAGLGWALFKQRR